MRCTSTEKQGLSLLLQVGDWGRDGHDNQTLVAAAMGQAATNLNFVISVGDNFYGLSHFPPPPPDRPFVS